MQAGPAVCAHEGDEGDIGRYREIWGDMGRYKPAVSAHEGDQHALDPVDLVQLARDADCLLGELGRGGLVRGGLVRGGAGRLCA